jgi:drug/metabolite transporter (DMT)-like permease
MTWIFLGVMIILYTLQSFLTRLYSDHYPGDPDMASPVFTIVSGLVVVFSALAVTGFRFAADWQTILLGLFNGVALVVYNNSIIKASQRGPYSVMMVFQISGAIIIPILVAAVAFDDQISVVQIVCIAVVLLSVYLIGKKDGEAKPRKGFWLASLLLGISNGIYGSILDVQQRITGPEQKEELVAVTFAVAVAISTVILASRQKKNFFGVMKQTKISLVYLLACSVIVAAGLFFLTSLISMMDLAILYTFDTSGVLVLSVLCSCVFLKEKISWKNALGCATMCLALICMSGWEWIIGLFVK